MKLWQVLIAGILTGILATGLLMLAIRRPAGEPIQLDVPPTAAPLQVYIAGAVNRPGVYPFPPGSRIDSAILAAGGLLDQADPGSLNLAAPLRDGDRVWVPARTTPTPAASTDLIPAASQVTPSADHPLNINTASQAELDLLPGIGEVKAAAIIAYREAHGSFLALEDLLDVPGITPSLFDGIKDLITLLPQS